MSYALDHRLWNGWAGGFHITNVLVHLGCTGLLFLLCLRTGASLAVGSLLATAFAISPRLTESVAWISGRTDLMAGFGALVAVLMHARPPTPWWKRGAAGVALLGGLLCKEVAFAGCAAVLFAVWYDLPRPRRVWQLLLHASPVLGALAIYSALRGWAMTGQSVPGSNLPRHPWLVFKLANEAIARYASMVLDPFRPRLQIGEVKKPDSLLSLLGFVVLVVGLLFAYRAWRGWTRMQRMALILGGTAVTMVLHIVKLDVNVVAADRFLYLPLATLAIVLTPSLTALWQRRRTWVLGASVVLLASFAVLTAQRARTWINEIVLWREEVEKSNYKTPFPLTRLAMALLQHNRYQEALDMLDRVPQEERHQIPMLRATCLARLGRVSESIPLLRAVAQSDPGAVLFKVNLMFAWAQARQFEQARQVAAKIVAQTNNPAVLGSIQRMERLAQDWAALPPEAREESLATKVQRADVLGRLGALVEAQAAWTSVALDPNAGQDLQLRAAQYVVQFGSRPAAQALLARLAQDRPSSAQVSALVVKLEDRFSDD